MVLNDIPKTLLNDDRKLTGRMLVESLLPEAGLGLEGDDNCFLFFQKLQNISIEIYNFVIYRK